MKKLSCEIIKDLLPLYSDGVCSPESRQAVEEHLPDCPACRSLYRQISRTEIDRALTAEAGAVVAKQKRRFRRKSFLVGTVFAGIFMIPILVCLIVNLAVGAALDWFFIVLTALMLTASLIVVPLMVPKNRFFFTLVSSLASLLLLLVSCAVYTGGTWFFVASSSVLFGISVVFLPIAVCCEPLRRRLMGYRALTVFAADTLLFALMMFCIGCSVGGDGFARIAFAASLPPLLYVWGMMLILRYLPLPKPARAGLCVLWTGLAVFFGDNVVGALLGSHLPLPRLSPLDWGFSALDGNIKWTVLILSAAVCIGLAIAGICRKEKHK